MILYKLILHNSLNYVRLSGDLGEKVALETGFCPQLGSDRSQSLPYHAYVSILAQFSLHVCAAQSLSIPLLSCAYIV